MSTYRQRRWYKRYAKMYQRLTEQGMPPKYALMALEECHLLLDANFGYGKARIARSAQDSVEKISLEVATHSFSRKKIYAELDPMLSLRDCIDMLKREMTA